MPMTRSQQSDGRIERLAGGTVLATLALMTLGSVVHGTGSSLACPDWPLCHGSALPSMTGGVRFEHSHRLAALAVVVLTAVLTRAVWRRADRGAKGLVLAACGLVSVQAALGAATVLLRLPPMVSVAHLATSMAYLSVLVTLAARLSGVACVRPDASTRSWLTLAVILAYGQIVLGAVVRHTGAALACSELPWCAGAAWPGGFRARVHMIHRATALVVLLVTVASTLVALRRTAPVGVRRAVVLAPAALGVAQVALGVLVVWTGAALPGVTAHHATAALLLASLVLARASC
jgi:heme A synthase